MHKILTAILSLTTLAACSAKLSLPPYQPTTSTEIDAAVEVNNFSYFPKEGVAQNEIRETAAGHVYLTEDVGTYFANAVRREMRQANMSIQSKNCTLDGEVNDFATDSLGYSVDYITDVRYILRRTDNQKTLFDNTYTVKFNASKFVVADVFFANINKMVSDNIDQLLKDSVFVTTTEENCAKD